jgi:hypothetical protein
MQGSTLIERETHFFVLVKWVNFYFILPSLLLLYKDKFMDDYDGILNCNGLKYSPFKILRL